MIFALLLALIPSTGSPPPPPIPPCPHAVALGVELGAAGPRVRAACAAERGLRAAGWGEPWIVGALANAWHESGWNPHAVGDKGRAVGFWQLRDDGLGKGMGDLRFRVGPATAAIIRSARRQKLRTDRGDVRTAADKFCQLIMRPSDKVRKGELRAETAARLSADDSI